MLYFAATIPTALYTALSCTDPCNLRHSSLRFLGRTCSQQCRYSFQATRLSSQAIQRLS